MNVEKHKNKTTVSPVLMQSLLGSIVHFMSRSGMSRSEIESCFQSSVQHVKDQKRPTRQARTSSLAIGCDTVAGAVLRSWHRTSKYLDQNALPKSLSIRGPAPNLEALVRAQDPRSDIKEVISAMCGTGLIKKSRNGRYIPTTSSATIREMHPLAVDHVAKTVMRLVETANRNTNSSSKKPPLIERYAHVPDLKTAESRAFANFTRQQGIAYLDAIEDWLESRRKRKGKDESRSERGSISAGVHVVAYLGDHVAESARRRKARTPTPALSAPA